MSEPLYVTGLKKTPWHIAAFKPTGYGVRTLCGRVFSEGQYRSHGAGVVGICKRCGVSR